MDPTLFDFTYVLGGSRILTVCDVLAQFYFKHECRYTFNDDQTLATFDPGQSGLDQPSTEVLQSALNSIQSLYGYYLLRQIRNPLLSDTDKYMISDFPISPTWKTNMSAYRETLRNLPDTLRANNTVIDVLNLNQYFPIMPMS